MAGNLERLLRAAALVLAVLPGARLAAQADAAQRWFSFDSRETASPPRLEMVLADGNRETVTADADTSLLSYRSDRPWGHLRTVSVSVGDTNRALLRFAVPAGAPIKEATLVLEVRMSSLPPTGTVEIGFHRVTAAWNEADATWANQPAWEEKSAQVAAFAPQDQTLRVEVTAVVNRWRSEPEANFGLLVRSARAPFQAEAALLGLFPWAETVAAARERAEKEKKLVLAVVRPTYKPADSSFSELTMLAVGFTDPFLRELVLDRYVPVRIACSPHQHLFPRQGSDPLAALGTSISRVKPLAIVVSAPDGAHQATLQSLGTFDPTLLRRFLLRAAGMDPAREKLTGARATLERGLGLVREGKAAEALKVLAGIEGSFDDPAVAGAAYYRAGLQRRAGDRAAATLAWKGLAERAPEAPFALKARLRLEWPERMAQEEPLDRLRLDAAGGSTETPYPVSRVEAVVHGAIDYVLAHQRADGSWPNLQIEAYDAAVTALVCRSLMLWRDRLDTGRRARAEAALKDGLAWLQRYVETAPPDRANSFSTAYVLSALANAAGHGLADKKVVAAAATLLVGGQCPNGGWSYDLGFGTRWKGGFAGWPATDRGRVHSMNTSIALIALAQAKSAGVPIDEPAVERGLEAMLAMRKAPAAFTYTYPDPECFETVAQSIGRACGCELALLLHGKSKREDLELAAKTFLQTRAELRKPVKLTSSWVPPAGVSSYFYMFAYFHAAEALTALGGQGAKRDLRTLGEDLLKVVEADGTWVDFDEVGKVYATAMALSVLRLAGLE